MTAHPVVRRRLTALYHDHAARGAHFVEHEGWLLPRSYGDPGREQAALREAAGLLDIGESGKIELKGGALGAVLAAAFPGAALPGVGRAAALAAAAGPARLYHLAAEQALLITAPEAAAGSLDLLAALTVGQHCTHVVDLTSARCGLRLLGPRAFAVLERLASLDLAPDRFADGAVVQGPVARVHALVARRDAGGVTGYDLYADRDLGAYLWQALLEAGGPLGLIPAGRDAEPTMGAAS